MYVNGHLADLLKRYLDFMAVIRLITNMPMPLGCSAFISQSRGTALLKLSMLPGLILETLLFFMSVYKAYGLGRHSIQQPLLAAIIQDRRVQI